MPYQIGIGRDPRTQGLHRNRIDDAGPQEEDRPPHRRMRVYNRSYILRHVCRRNTRLAREEDISWCLGQELFTNRLAGAALISQKSGLHAFSVPVPFPEP